MYSDVVGKAFIVAILLLIAMILEPIDAILLWVRFPNPLWMNIVDSAGVLMFEVLVIRKLTAKPNKQGRDE